VFPFLFKILFYGLAQGVVPIKTIDYFSTARNCYRGSCQIYYSFTFLFNTNRPRLVTLQKILDHMVKLIYLLLLLSICSNWTVLFLADVRLINSV